MSETFVSSIEYVLGEQERPYCEASGFGEFGMPDLPQMWGWGMFRTSQTDVLQLERATLRACISRADIDPGEIDFILRCRATSSAFGMPSEVGAMLTDLGLTQAYPVSVSANGCDALLVGVQQAAATVTAGQAKTVIVVCADVHPSEESRFQKAGIFSDAACACLVRAEPGEGDFRISGAARITDPKTMHPEAGFQSDLAVSLNDRLLLSRGHALVSVSKVFTNNLFLPITLTKEQEAGFEDEQIYTDNVPRIGHCYSADPFINLADFSRQGSVRQGDNLLLISDAPGVRTGLAICAT